jgi:hypothetical protein
LQQHTVRIALDAEGNPLPFGPDGLVTEMNRIVACGDEIRWLSDDGDVEVEFHVGTPLLGGVTKGDSNFRTVGDVREKFDYTCTVTTPDGRKHGWPESSKGGGGVEVGSGSSTGSS